MADVKKLVPHILKWEGGWANDPDDLGGATNKGVTFKTYKKYCKMIGKPQPSVGDLRRLDDEEFTDILKTLYWNVCKADFIESQSVANLIVDWAWNSGAVTAIKHVQRIVGVEDDGIVGKITLAAINSRSPLPLFGQIREARIDYYHSITNSRPANSKFLRGWLNRVNDFQFED